MSKLINTLHELRVGCCYCGYRMVVIAIDMSLENEDCLLCVSSDIYPTIIEHCGGTPYTVERNLRTVAKRAWQQNRELLEAIAGYPLQKPPSAKNFIEIMYTHVVRDT